MCDPAKQAGKEAIGRAYCLAGGAVVIGMVFLLLDLSHPELFFLLFLKPTASYITFGSFSLLALVVCVEFFAIVYGTTLWCPPRALVMVMRVLLVAAALCVSLYAGLFLYSIYTVSAWRTLLVPCLFFLSSLSTGMALVYLAVPWSSMPLRWEKVLSILVWIDTMLIVIEAILIALYVAWLIDTSPSSAELLLNGSGAPWLFGGFMLCGLVLPFVFNILALRFKMSTQVHAAIALLFGGLSLRVSVALGGFPL